MNENSVFVGAMILMLLAGLSAEWIRTKKISRLVDRNLASDLLRTGVLS